MAFQMPTAGSHEGVASTRRQNSRSLAMRVSRLLPVMIAALIAPMDVPMIQAGSTPASCIAS